MRKQNTFFAAVIILLLAVVFASTLTSCNILRKHKTKSEVTIDSVAVTKTTEATVSASDSTGTTKTEKASTLTFRTENETLVELHFGDDTGKSEITINGSTIKTSGPKPTKATFKATGTTASKDSTGEIVITAGEVSKYDSSGKSRGDSTSVFASEKTSSAIKKSTRFPIGAVIGFVILGLACLVLYWLFGPPKEDKKK